MTAETTETTTPIDQTETVETTSAVLEQLETISEIERAQLDCVQLIFAVILVYITFRLLLSFVGRAFGSH